MANLAQVLKDEIRRLARKELKEQTDAIKKQAAQHRRDIAALKRDNSQLARRVAVLEKQRAKQGAPAGSKPEDLGNIRFSAKGLASHRERLGLSAGDFGLLVGVSGQTIYAWEQERTRPRQSQLPGIAKVRAMGLREARAQLEQAQED